MTEAMPPVLLGQEPFIRIIALNSGEKPLNALIWPVTAANPLIRIKTQCYGHFQFYSLL